MSILGDLQAVAARLSLQDSRPTCAFCGKGKLVLIAERPDPNFGALGVVEQTLRCDRADCGKITIDSTGFRRRGFRRRRCAVQHVAGCRLPGQHVGHE